MFLFYLVFCFIFLHHSSLHTVVMTDLQSFIWLSHYPILLSHKTGQFISFELSELCSNRENDPSLPLDACPPRLVILSLFSQQLIDLLSCRQSWSCSLANKPESTMLLQVLSCQIMYLFLFSVVSSLNPSALFLPLYPLLLPCHLCHIDLELLSFQGGWIHFDLVMPLTRKSLDILEYCILVWLAVR